MFEDALVESSGRLKSRSKYWMLATLAFNLSVLATLILIPLLRPQSLPRTVMAPLVSLPPRQQALAKPVPPRAAQPVRTKAPLSAMVAPTRVPRTVERIQEPPAPAPAENAVIGGMTGTHDSAASGILSAMGTASPAPVAVTKPERPKPALPVHVSSGVATGALLNKSTPVYPAIARAAHVSGVVLLHAIISKSGTIETLQVVSGPEMLRGSALNAIRQWRYRPYLLNGEPTEVETTITVNFFIGA